MLFAIIAIFSCNESTDVTIKHGGIQIDFNTNLKSKISFHSPGTNDLMKEYCSSEFLSTTKGDFIDFKFEKSVSTEINDKSGKGTITEIYGNCKKDGYEVKKIISITAYEKFNDMLVFKVKYINTGKKQINVTGWTNNHYKISKTSDVPAFYSFQGSSSGERADWILPVDTGFYKENYMGMVNSDYGGGIPIVDLWRKDAGIAIGHVEKVPKMVSLPVQMDVNEDCAEVGVSEKFRNHKEFKTSDTLNTIETFVSVHTGDYFNTMKQYAAFMQTKGIIMPPSEPSAFEPVWCAWGYMRKFTVDEILGTLPKVKELGLKWVDIDDGYQIAEGNWNVDRSKFPNGNGDMRKLVDKIHSYSLKAKLWWAPLAVDPGADLLKQNPDIILLSEDGAPRYITWWDSYYMSPSNTQAIEHTKDMVKLFISEWDYDGLKMDGQHMNCIPPDFSSESNLENPEEAPEQLPEFFKMIMETAQQYKKNAVIQNCPCGDVMSFYHLPYLNQTVASDPMSSRQIRSKGKTFKALIPRTAYYGDHVELSDSANDFASQFGIGSVLGTKFTYPKDNPYSGENNVLTPEKETVLKKWISLYNQKMLSKGDYLGELYDIGYDKPETHVIQKGDTLFYAFYTPEFDGNIELRGLQPGNYKVFDYINEKDLGNIKVSEKEVPKFTAKFNRSLLIEVYPFK